MMVFETDKLRAFCDTLRDYVKEIKRVAQEKPDTNTERIVSLANAALHFTE